MQNTRFVWLFFLFVISCATSRKVNSAAAKELNLNKEWQLGVKALNLSEDMSPLSTGEDEIILFLYEYQDKLAEPLLSMEYQFHKGDEQDFTFSYTCDTLLLFLIEKDSERSIRALEAITRINTNDLMQAADTKDYELEKKLLDDDDLLSYQIIDRSMKKFTLEGRKTMDRYVYEFELTPPKPNH